MAFDLTWYECWEIMLEFCDCVLNGSSAISLHHRSSDENIIFTVHVCKSYSGGYIQSIIIQKFISTGE